MDLCDCCGTPSLESIYIPTDSLHNITVAGCGHCGLVQSLPRVDQIENGDIARSSDLSWDHVRFGKGFRTQQNLDVIRTHVGLSGFLNVLDVGSNRGSFCTSLKTQAPNAKIVAVEPDWTFSETYQQNPNVEMIQDRIENVRLRSDSFDLVYSCHTLEHLRSPAKTLYDHFRVLRPGGWLFIEVPNIELLKAEDIVEEWFVDKHLYHYSAEVLLDQLAALGFEAVDGPDITDPLNISILARKTQTGTGVLPRNTDRLIKAKQLVQNYQTSRERNLTAVRQVARQIEGYKPQRVVIWGAGRLLNSLVQYGELNPRNLAGIVDKYLTKYTHNGYDVALMPPTAVGGLQPDVIVVMSRSFYDEIAQEARNRVPNAQVLSYSELLVNARERVAA